jgi:hypothetical protein
MMRSAVGPGPVRRGPLRRQDHAVLAAAGPGRPGRGRAVVRPGGHRAEDWVRAWSRRCRASDPRCIWTPRSPSPSASRRMPPTRCAPGRPARTGSAAGPAGMLRSRCPLAGHASRRAAPGGNRASTPRIPGTEASSRVRWGYVLHAGLPCMGAREVEGRYLVDRLSCELTRVFQAMGYQGREKPLSALELRQVTDP